MNIHLQNLGFSQFYNINSLPKGDELTYLLYKKNINIGNIMYQRQFNVETKVNVFYLDIIIIGDEWVNIIRFEYDMYWDSLLMKSFKSIDYNIFSSEKNQEIYYLSLLQDTEGYL